MLDTCPVISCGSVMSVSDTGTAKKVERYKTLLNKHLETLYQFAGLVNNSETPKTQSDLSAKILRPVDPELPNMPMTFPEKKIKDWLDRQPHDVNVADAVRQFAKVPYGWSDFATIYYLNELIRRHLYAYNYNNNPNVSREDTARNIVRDANKFTVEKAKAISQEILNNFIEAWKHIFNVVSVKGSNDSTELFRNCKETDDSALNKLLKNYRDLSRKINGCPFAHTIDEAITLMEQWLTIREDLKFFETIIAARETASQLFDRCKNINTFFGDQFDRYQMLTKFLDDNRENFEFLPDDYESVRSLRSISNDEEPWERMPSYTKLQKMLNVKLQEKKKELVKDVTDKYNSTFDDLEKYAESVKVERDKFAKRDITITQKTSSNNFYALVANADTATFYEQQMEKIDAAKTDGGPTRKRKVVHLSTHTTKAMQTEADIDLYLQSLKAQLMQHLADDTDVFVS